MLLLNVCDFQHAQSPFLRMQQRRCHQFHYFPMAINSTLLFRFVIILLVLSPDSSFSMAGQYHLLSDVNTNSDGWKLRVRVVRLWYQHVYMNPSQRSSMDMVLMDEEGSRISASVRASLVSRFQGILVEGGVYSLSSFAINDNDLRVKLTTHSCRISFVRHTNVKGVNSGFPFQRSMFAFVRFGSIVERRVAENQAVDVIGVLSGYTDLTETTSDGHPTKRVSFELQDHERRRLRCTLWSEHAEHFAERAPSFHGSGYVIVIIQLGKVRNWLDTKQVGQACQTAIMEQKLSLTVTSPKLDGSGNVWQKILISPLNPLSFWILKA